MWGKSWKELERRVKDVEVLLKEFTDAMVLDGRKWHGRLNKLENKVDTLGLKERRITKLEQQVNDLMNREEEWKRRLAKIETGMIVDQMKVGGVWKEEGTKFNIEVGDLVVDKRNQTRVRTVTQLNADRIKLENGSMQGVYSGADWIIRFQFDWKLLVKKEDFKEF